MKKLCLLSVLFAFVSCDREKPATPLSGPKIQSVSEIPVPKNVGPPVQAKPYDDGYKAGDLAGAAAAKSAKAQAPKKRSVSPTPEALDVLALEAAGTDPERAQKWQRGYAAGYHDGFLREAEGLR